MSKSGKNKDNRYKKIKLVDIKRLINLKKFVIISYKD